MPMLNCTRPKRDGWEKFNLSPQASRARRSGQSETWDLPAGRLLKPDLFAKCHRQPGLLSFHETKEVQVTSVAYLHSIPGRQTIRLNKTTTVASPKKKASQKSHFRSENHLPVLQSLGSHVSFRVKIVTHTVWFSNFIFFCTSCWSKMHRQHGDDEDVVLKEEPPSFEAWKAKKDLPDQGVN